MLYFSTRLLVVTVSLDSKSIHNPKFTTLFSGSSRFLCFFAIVLIYKRGNPGRQTVDCCTPTFYLLHLRVFCSVLDALSDSKGCLSSSIPTLNTRMTQNLTERSCRFLKSASEVPRLYRRTNKVSKVEYTHMFLLLFSVYFVTCLPWRSKGQKDCSAIFFVLGFHFIF